MPSLDDLRKRISSVKSTQKITKAMKMVAAAKLRRAQENAERGRPYSEKMNKIILKDDDATNKFGQLIASKILALDKRSIEIHLEGDLGSGKTFLTLMSAIEALDQKRYESSRACVAPTVCLSDGTERSKKYI